MCSFGLVALTSFLASVDIASALCTAPVVANAPSPACQEGASIVDGGTCTATCLPGFTADYPSLVCESGLFNPVTFSCGVQCNVPDGEHTAAVPCVEGRVIQHGKFCTSQCAAGLTPYETRLQCDNGNLDPSPIIHCKSPCRMPIIDGAEDPPCVEGSSIPEHGTCTPQCDDKHVLLDSTINMRCANGSLSPPSFSCRRIKCSLPATEIWTRDFPGDAAQDYPAEPVCPTTSTYSSDGNGCETCYGPDLEITANAPRGGLGVGSAARMRLLFRSLGGRRLQFKFVNDISVTWGLRSDGSGSATTWSTNHEASLAAFGLSSQTAVSGVSLGVVHANENLQIDTGAVTGLETSFSSVALAEPLIRAFGAQVFLNLKFTMRYVIAGCSFNRKGYGSLQMSVELESLAYNVSSCASGSSEACSPTCGIGFSGEARAVCTEDAGTFELQGCHADCQALLAFNALTATSGIPNAQDPSCIQGGSVPHGVACTTSCSPGFTPVPASLQCQDGRFPSQFACHENCIPPVTAQGGNPPCEELLHTTVLPHGGTCTPRCILGYRPVASAPLACANGLLSPSTFRCVALLVQVLQKPSSGAYHWATFSDSKGPHVVTAANSKDQSITSLVYDALLGGTGRFSLDAKAKFESTVVDAIPVVVERSIIILATSLERGLGLNGTGGPSPVYRYHSEDDTLEVIQQLPIAGSSQIVAASISGTSLLIAGSCKPPLPSSLVFSWNSGSMKFEESQQIDIVAKKLETFNVNGTDFLFAASVSSHSSKLYQWKVVNGIGLYESVLDVSTPSVSALSWLGCRNALGFADREQRPCHLLTVQHCSDAATREACGSLCGCVHAKPLLAIALSYEPASLSVFELNTNSNGTMRFDAKQQSLVPRPINTMCSMFSPSRQELFLLATVDNSIVDSIDIETASRFYVLDSSRFGSNLDGLELVQSVASRGSTCTSISGVGNSYMLVSGPTPDIGVTAFALESNFIWYAEAWTPCSPSCRLFGFEVSFRNRGVSCKGVPSGFVYEDALCPFGLKPVAEEKCAVNICSAVHQYEWHSGLWGPCEGECGVGTRYRPVQCIRRDDKSVVEPSNCSVITGTAGLKPSSSEPCDLHPCSSFRLVNRVALAKRWHIAELRFYVDDECTQTVVGLPFSAGECADCVCKNASGIWGRCTADLAFDGLVPYFTNKGQLVAGTEWISECGGGYRCSSGETWIGIHSDIVLSVRCVKIYQSGDPSNAASEIALESWDTSRLVWAPIVEWAQVDIGRWVSLGVERACNSLLDCSGKGIVQGLPGQCVCSCVVGYTGLHCEFCAVGFEGYPSCQPQKKSSKSWRLIALEFPSGGTWHVADITMHTDVACSAGAKIPKTAIYKYIASYEGADSGMGPERAFDEGGSRTVWISKACGAADLESCNISAPWIGVEFLEEQVVKCVRIQQGHKEFAVDAIALQLWSTQLSQGQWAPLRDWRGIVVSAETGYFLLRLVCEDGIPIDDTIEQDCDTQKLPWESCQVWCRAGFTGKTETFVCGDDYIFQGVQPSCQPNECNKGIPNGQGVVIDDCLSKVMEQKCQATCGPGYYGDSVNYVCLADGYWHDETSRRIGVVPACIEGLPVVQEEVVSFAVVHSLDTWLALLMTSILRASAQ